MTENSDSGTVAQSDRAQAAQDARANFINDMQQIFKDLIDDSSSTPPVVFVPSGTRLTIFSNEDLWLRSEDEDEEDLVKELGEADKKAKNAPQEYKEGQRQIPTTVQTKDGRYIQGSGTYKPLDPQDAKVRAEDNPVPISDTPAPKPANPTGKSLSLNEIYSGNQGVVSYPVSAGDKIAEPVLPSTGDIQKSQTMSPDLF